MIIINRRRDPRVKRTRNSIIIYRYIHITTILCTTHFSLPNVVYEVRKCAEVEYHNKIHAHNMRMRVMFNNMLFETHARQYR